MGSDPHRLSSLIEERAQPVRYPVALWLFGVPVSILGLWLWNGLGPSLVLVPRRAE